MPCTKTAPRFHTLPDRNNLAEIWRIARQARAQRWAPEHQSADMAGLTIMRLVGKGRCGRDCRDLSRSRCTPHGRENPATIARNIIVSLSIPAASTNSPPAEPRAAHSPINADISQSYGRRKRPCDPRQISTTVKIREMPSIAARGIRSGVMGAGRLSVEHLFREACSHAGRPRGLKQQMEE